MRQLKTATGSRFLMAIGLLTVGLSLPLFAYQQGTYLLFEIRDDTGESKGASRQLVVSSSIFKLKNLKAKTGAAGKRTKSEFETEITSFQMEASDSVSTGIEILDEQEERSETESTFGKPTPASGGFFFDY